MPAPYNGHSPIGDSLYTYSPLLTSRASNSIGEMMKIVQSKPRPSELGLSPTRPLLALLHLLNDEIAPSNSEILNLCQAEK